MSRVNIKCIFLFGWMDGCVYGCPRNLFHLSLDAPIASSVYIQSTRVVIWRKGSWGGKGGVGGRHDDGPIKNDSSGERERG